MTHMKIDYRSTVLPDDYICGDCGAKGVKLWRSGMFSIELRCAACACAKCGVSDAVVDDNGDTMSAHGKTDQIGDRNTHVPAVPTPDNRAYWGYSSSPDDAVQWWKSIPTRA